MTDIFASPTLLEGYTRLHAAGISLALLAIAGVAFWLYLSRRS